jgi:hypothetical protein
MEASRELVLARTLFEGALFGAEAVVVVDDRPNRGRLASLQFSPTVS